MHIFIGFDKIPVKVEPDDTFADIRMKASISNNLFVLNGEIVLDEDLELSECPIEDGMLIETKKASLFKFDRYKIFFTDDECIGDIEVLRNISNQMFEMMLIHSKFMNNEKKLLIFLERALDDTDKTTSMLKYTNIMPEEVFKRRKLPPVGFNFVEIIVERIRNYPILLDKIGAENFQLTLDQLILYGNLSNEDCVSIVNSSYRIGTFYFKFILENSTLSRFINDSKVADRCASNGDMGTFINISEFLSLQRLMEIHRWIVVTNGDKLFMQLVEQKISERIGEF